MLLSIEAWYVCQAWREAVANGFKHGCPPDDAQDDPPELHARRSRAGLPARHLSHVRRLDEADPLVPSRSARHPPAGPLPYLPLPGQNHPPRRLRSALRYGFRGSHARLRRPGGGDLDLRGVHRGLWRAAPDGQGAQRGNLAGRSAGGRHVRPGSRRRLHGGEHVPLRDGRLEGRSGGSGSAPAGAWVRPAGRAVCDPPPGALWRYRNPACRLLRPPAARLAPPLSLLKASTYCQLAGYFITHSLGSTPSVSLFLSSLKCHHPLASLARATEDTEEKPMREKQKRRKRRVPIVKSVPLLSTKGEHREKRFCYRRPWLFSVLSLVKGKRQWLPNLT